ncbi:hypothetical protein [Bacillus pseudomycoides]|uniref:hypothetical protein n=1 Tax=Bacillus pseudomycoides TaxID=64104 RepID=UPI001FB2B490|nr:hypothetical protein [Bacillus pseudomycoides]
MDGLLYFLLSVVFFRNAGGIPFILLASISYMEFIIQKIILHAKFSVRLIKKYFDIVSINRAEKI